MGVLNWTLAPTIADTHGVQIAKLRHVASGKVTTSAAAAPLPAMPGDFQGLRLTLALTAKGSDQWVRFDGPSAAVGAGNFIVDGATAFFDAEPGAVGSVIDDA